MLCAPIAAQLTPTQAGADAEFPFNIDSLVEDGSHLPGSSGGGLAQRGGGSTPWGVKSSQGERQSMEDAWSVHFPMAAQAEAVSCSDARSGSDEGAAGAHWVNEDLNFFGVYDGHGGREVAQHCADNLHRHFAKQLSLSCQRGPGVEQEPQKPGTASIGASPQQEPAAAGASTPASTEDGPQQLKSLGSSRRADDSSGIVRGVGDALREAFLLTDKELAGTDAGDFVGATAVVAVLGKAHIWIAHCGDSRAVIQRNGESTPITRDHKPDREDEAARVRAAGGRIVFNSGAARIMGMLAMSRAIGDHFLRPYVIAEPEITVVERATEDEVLVIATDGLWDVFSCKEATSLAQRCIARSKDRGMSRYGGCRVAASVLTKVAMERGSRDNITVIVVDITQTPEASSPEEPAELMVPSSANNEDGSARDDVTQSGYSVGCTVVLLKSRSERQSDGSPESGPQDGQGGDHCSAPSCASCLPAPQQLKPGAHDAPQQQQQQENSQQDLQQQQRGGCGTRQQRRLTSPLERLEGGRAQEAQEHGVVEEGREGPCNREEQLLACTPGGRCEDSLPQPDVEPGSGRLCRVDGQADEVTPWQCRDCGCRGHECHDHECNHHGPAAVAAAEDATAGAAAAPAQQGPLCGLKRKASLSAGEDEAGRPCKRLPASLPATRSHSFPMMAHRPAGALPLPTTCLSGVNSLPVAATWPCRV